MALSFANLAGNFYNRIGRFGKLARVTRAYQDDLKTYFDALMAQFDSSVASPLQVGLDGLPADRDNTRDSVGTFMDTIKSNAKTTLIEMVKADKPTSSNSVGDALYEVYLQMVTGGATLKTCTVTGSSAVGSINSGDGRAVISLKRGDGRNQELAYDEVAYLRCTADSQTGGVTEGAESFVYVGAPKPSSVWGYSYPDGSGYQTSISAIRSSDDATASRIFGNMLQNGDMEDFTSNLPGGWTAVVGAAGVDFQESTLTIYDGLKSLQFVGSATLTSIKQLFDAGSATLGSLATLAPQSSYAFSMWAKTSNIPAAGVLTVELIDATNTVINDDQGVANSFTVDLAALGTAFVNKNGVFRLPKLLPSAVYLRLRLSTALSAGTNLFLDHLALGRLSPTYDGGPGIAVFSGATRFVANDYFTLTTTNDYGGTNDLSTFQWLMDRLFSTRTYSILFPTSGAPSVSDALITA